jgi:hypothetical protein
MSKDNVSYISKKTLLELTSKNASFNSESFAVNNNENIQITLQTVSASSLVSSAKIQGSIDGSSWFDLDSTSATITTNDDILWSLSQIEGLQFIRVSVTITSGSAIFSISARGA